MNCDVLYAQLSHFYRHCYRAYGNIMHSENNSYKTAKMRNCMHIPYIWDSKLEKVYLMHSMTYNCDKIPNRPKITDSPTLTSHLCPPSYVLSTFPFLSAAFSALPSPSMLATILPNRHVVCQNMTGSVAKKLQFHVTCYWIWNRPIQSTEQKVAF